MFKSLHLALPVRDLDKSVAFFQKLFSAEVIVRDMKTRRCTVSYDHFEFSLFEVVDFCPWAKRELGPFHIGHELSDRGEVDAIFQSAIEFGCGVVCSPFDREDGDYACFIRDEQGVVFEFFSGRHHLARARLEKKDII